MRLGVPVPARATTRATAALLSIGLLLGTAACSDEEDPGQQPDDAASASETAEPGPEVAKLGTPRWFEADDGHQVHLTVDADHKPSARAHTAILLGDALDEVLARVEASGGSSYLMTFDGDRHAFTNDPAGNLWELIGPPE